MKVLYDHQMFSLQKYGGITKYFCELIKNYPEGHSYYLSLLFSDNQHLKDDSAFFRKFYLPVPSRESRLKHIVRDNSYSINNQYSRYCLKHKDYDLFHPTYFDPYFLGLTKKPYVITVHDLIAFKFEEVYRKDYQMSRMTTLVNKAARVISVSENTKNDIVTILKIDPEKIDVVHHGFNRAAPSESRNAHGRYLLYVGTRKAYKNFSRLAHSFSRLIEKDDDLRLICVGAPFSAEELAELKKLKIENRTIAMGVSENQLNNLYSNALAFVYPTLYEGFGMPVLEAFANDCPVCLSNTSSLPEVAGSGGVYFDPTDIDSITSSISKVIYDTRYAGEMIREGNKRLNQFSWVKCADQTIKTYQTAISTH